MDGRGEGVACQNLPLVWAAATARRVKFRKSSVGTYSTRNNIRTRSTRGSRRVYDNIYRVIFYRKSAGKKGEKNRKPKGGGGKKTKSNSI